MSTYPMLLQLRATALPRHFPDTTAGRIPRAAPEFSAGIPTLFRSAFDHRRLAMRTGRSGGRRWERRGLVAFTVLLARAFF